MSSQSKIITGASLPPGTTAVTMPVRMNVKDFVNNEKHFSLYVQALEKIHTTPQNEPKSHFQIGGIHGLPFVPWEGAGSSQPAVRTGYCTHGTVLFPTWHRPYIALYEQTIQGHALTIAEDYQVDQAAWKAAAQTLRVPYWDWAQNAVPPSKIIEDTTVQITGFDNKKKQIPNPFLAYKFNPISDQFQGAYSRWPQTLRAPDGTGPNAKTNVTKLKRILQSAANDLRDSTYFTLTQTDDWAEFSNHSRTGGSANSLEAVHDAVHDYVGGMGAVAGHMGVPGYAGFDPLFYLHHANVDRLLSMWQALHPNIWVSPGLSSSGTWTIPPNTVEDKNTPLTPFWNSDSGFWLSSTDGVVTPGESQEGLGYTYEDVKGKSQSQVKALVDRLYGGLVALPGPGLLDPGKIGRFTAVHPNPDHAQGDTSDTPVAAPKPHPNPVSENPGGIYTWTVQIEVKKYELHHSFSVLVFIGEPPESPEDWSDTDCFVGVHSIFANSPEIRAFCDNCVIQRDLVTEGFVHLTSKLGTNEELAKYLWEPKEVVPYLKENLHWRVLMNGEYIPVEQTPSLKVSVFSQFIASELGHAELRAGKSYHNEITDGRSG